MNIKKVWFITGASKGLGAALVKELLKNGTKVVATSRKKANLTENISLPSEDFLPLETDLTDEKDVEKSIKQAIEYFGSIDVVVNNAGYGQFGAIEEVTDAEAKQNFEVNVFGALNMIRKVTPYLREQKKGHIINIASVGGFIGNFPGWGVYCATKFAVVGFTEALAEEMKAFDVQVTAVCPGYFRTNFLTEGSVQKSKNQYDTYASARASQKMHFDQIDGHQPGDPQKAAQAIIQLNQLDNPPVHLFLGSDAYQFADEKAKLIQETLKNHKELSTSTEFTEEPAGS